jgi:manganese/zinc/iron transport system substrate-binding protein
MNWKPLALLGAIAIASFIFSGCKSSADSNDDPTIAATTSIIADVVQNLVGDQVKVVSLMGPGVDPHLYKASQGDVQLLQNADMILYNGLHLEGKMSEILEKLGRVKSVTAVSDGLDSSLIRTINQSANVHDPHIWFDVNLWRSGVIYISSEIKIKFPDLASNIDQNTKVYLGQMDSVLLLCNNMIANLPKEKRILITSHDAFEYFGRSNGFEVRGLQGISTLSESGLKDVTEMVNFIINKNVKAVFVENSVPQKALRSVIDGCKSKGHDVVVGGELFSDALGASRTPEGTYLGMIEFNIRTIVNALK